MVVVKLKNSHSKQTMQYFILDFSSCKTVFFVEPVCVSSGTLALRFDNSYSLFTPKMLRLVIWLAGQEQGSEPGSDDYDQQGLSNLSTEGDIASANDMAGRCSYDSTSRADADSDCDDDASLVAVGCESLPITQGALMDPAAISNAIIISSDGVNSDGENLRDITTGPSSSIRQFYFHTHMGDNNVDAGGDGGAAHVGDGCSFGSSSSSSIRSSSRSSTRIESGHGEPESFNNRDTIVGNVSDSSDSDTVNDNALQAVVSRQMQVCCCTTTFQSKRWFVSVTYNVYCLLRQMVMALRKRIDKLDSQV